MKARVKRVITPLTQYGAKLKGDIIDVPQALVYRWPWALEPAKTPPRSGRSKAPGSPPQDKMMKSSDTVRKEKKSYG